MSSDGESALYAAAAGGGPRERAQIARRVRAALGPEPLDDGGHFLAPFSLPPVPAPPPLGPQPATQFVVDLLGANAVTGERVAALLTAKARTDLGFPKVWGRTPGGDEWTRFADALPDDLFGTLALCWDLTGPGLLSDGSELARDLGARFARAARLATDLGRTADPRESPEAGAARAARLADLRERFGRSVEMRLVPASRPFPARQVWRAAHSLGLRWGEQDLFHWYDATGRTRLFTLSGLGAPGYLLPEHAAEGGSVAGLGLSFDLPASPTPVAVFDRMALALAFLRQKLGGRPVTNWGADLDADRLEAERDSLEEVVAEMARANIAPGSPEAARLF